MMARCPEGWSGSGIRPSRWRGTMDGCLSLVPMARVSSESVLVEEITTSRLLNGWLR